MKIVYDPPKRLRNLESRGLDFEDVGMEFFASAVVFPARDGRYKAIGFLNGMIIAVIFRPLGMEAISIISMRRASRKERQAL